MGKQTISHRRPEEGIISDSALFVGCPKRVTPLRSTPIISETPTERRRLETRQTIMLRDFLTKKVLESFPLSVFPKVWRNKNPVL